ncbi:MAG: hypothetical protein NTU98_00160 [Bacteroidetes bacterium]|nr:hypothetical protein [Bacteroidota bacterium]
MTAVKDRYLEIQEKDVVTGIDFVYVDPSQTKLTVYFIPPATVRPKTLLGVIPPEKVSIRSITKTKLSRIPVKKVLWAKVDDRDVLELTTPVPGDFTLYRLTIEHDLVDPWFNGIPFSFKTNCPTGLDCRLRDPECPPEEMVDFPVDYQARDFWSYRKALFDFASLRYPDWKERLEADSGVMLAELMSALGDEMAYYQDRIGREAYLETATQRRSLRRLADLVDHHVHYGAGGTTWLDIASKAMSPQNIPSGTDVWAVSDDGTQINYEIGNGISEYFDGTSYAVDPELNSIAPYIMDDGSQCLSAGATEMYIAGHYSSRLNAPAGKWVFLLSRPDHPAIPERSFLLKLTGAEDMNDLLNGHPMTRISWEKNHALPFEVCLNNVEVHGNAVPATTGKLSDAWFVTGLDPDDLDLDTYYKKLVNRAIEREGREDSVAYLFSLPDSDAVPLVWLGPKPRQTSPEIMIFETDIVSKKLDSDGQLWDFTHSFVGINSSLPEDHDYSLDEGYWKRVVGYRRIGKEIVHQDYASNEGMTVRFGDGEFGRIPAEGTVFHVYYRLGATAGSNVAAGSIRKWNAADLSLDFISSVNNPLPVTNGLDAETIAEIRKVAPREFRSVAYRAVIPDDYAEATERLDWVQKAGACFRWTGSWLSAFVTPDPENSVELSDQEREELSGQLDRFRQAGREVNIMDPHYADLDLAIKICVEPYAYRSEVKEAVMEKLLGKKGVRPVTGFFSPDNFTFGTLLYRSVLEAAIQEVPGVRAVVWMHFKRRGYFTERVFAEPWYNPGKNSIIRVENDLIHPERGTVKLYMEGGA